MIQGLEVTPNGRIIVADKANRNIKMFDNDGKFLSSYLVSYCIFDHLFIAAVNDAEVILSLTIEKDLKILDIERNRIRLKETISLEEDFGFILACEDKIVAIPFFGSTVNLLDRGGNILWMTRIDETDETERYPAAYMSVSGTSY